MKDYSSFGKTFGDKNNSSVHVNNKEKDILILKEGPTDGLDNTKLTPDTEYSINFTEQQRKFCLGLYYNDSNRFFYANGAKIYQFKAKDSEIVAYPLCLGNIANNFANANVKKTGLNGYVHDFSVM